MLVFILAVLVLCAYFVLQAGRQMKFHGLSLHSCVKSCISMYIMYQIMSLIMAGNWDIGCLDFRCALTMQAPILVPQCQALADDSGADDTECLSFFGRWKDVSLEKMMSCCQRFGLGCHAMQSLAAERGEGNEGAASGYLPKLKHPT